MIFSRIQLPTLFIALLCVGCTKSNHLEMVIFSQFILLTRHTPKYTNTRIFFYEIIPKAEAAAANQFVCPSSMPFKISTVIR
jgi:hypothetical protein